MTSQDYSSMTVEELRAHAANFQIEGRSSMNKDELVDALESRAAEREPAGTINVPGQGPVDVTDVESELPRVEAERERQEIQSEPGSVGS